MRLSIIDRIKKVWLNHGVPLSKEFLELYRHFLWVFNCFSRFAMTSPDIFPETMMREITLLGTVWKIICFLFIEARSHSEFRTGSRLAFDPEVVAGLISSRMH